MSEYDHRCDSGDFDRSICAEPCGIMHSYCTTCGKRADVCAHEAAFSATETSPGATSSAKVGTGATGRHISPQGRYFIAPDAFGNATIWRENGDYPKPILGDDGNDRETEAFWLTVDLMKRAEKAEAELDRLHTWDGLMSLLDEHWPEVLIPTLPDDDTRDPGPRIVSLLRWVERAEAAFAHTCCGKTQAAERTSRIHAENAALAAIERAKNVESERDALRATVERVEALVAEWEEAAKTYGHYVGHKTTALRAALASPEATEPTPRVGFRYQDGEILSLPRMLASKDDEIPEVVIDRGDGEWLTPFEIHAEATDAGGEG